MAEKSNDLRKYKIKSYGGGRDATTRNGGGQTKKRRNRGERATTVTILL